VIIALPPFWDFATSGLEMGVVFAWLGGCFWAMVAFTRATTRSQARRRVGLALLLGLGPLIRPDLVLFSACFLAAVLIAEHAPTWRTRTTIVAAAVALPLAYEVFRMGYYAAVVPNTAIAKDASRAQWGHGVHYLRNLIAPYQLEIGIAVVAAAIAVVVVRLAGQHARSELAVVLAPVAGGLLHGLYVVRVGGDFMQARLLLPAVVRAGDAGRGRGAQRQACCCAHHHAHGVGGRLSRVRVT
jgi:arabinofuranosyltransferase